MSTIRLVRERRFGPFFWTQFLGALNDNVFKNALILLLTFSQLAGGSDPQTLVNLGAGLFIAPFFLLSALAGQLADKFEKSRLIRQIKLFELGLMLLAAVGLFFENSAILLTILALMGAQSALFGPVKYSILPQVLDDRELVSGNALVETGTFLAILMGTIAGGILISIDDWGRTIVSATIVLLALIGYLSARRIPEVAAADPNLRIEYALWRPTLRAMGYARSTKAVFSSVLGISWFWLCGAVILAQIPAFATQVLGGNEAVVTGLLAIFSVGIGLGSQLCERTSGAKVEPGIVPLGALGISVFSIDLFFASHNLGEIATQGAFDIPWRIALDMALLGVFGGLFIVPLYAIIQQRSPAHARSRVVAANNILNALFMVVASAAAIAWLSTGLSIPQLFLALGVTNILVVLYIIRLLPEFSLRFVVWIIIRCIYRLRSKCSDALPEAGPALVVCNHVSFVDALILAASFRRPIRFVMDSSIYALPGLNYLFRAARTIPIAPKHRDEAMMNAAFDAIADGLAAGDVICIFPEGKITKDGAINTFRTGVERILARTPVPVLPVAIRGLWGSLFSRHEVKIYRRRPRKLWARVEVESGSWVQAEQASAQGLQAEVARLRADSV